MAVYDLLGREVAVLVQGNQSAGWHEVAFEAGDLPAGVYLYRLTQQHLRAYADAAKVA